MIARLSIGWRVIGWLLLGERLLVSCMEFRLFESDFHLRYSSDVRLLARDSLTAMGGWDRVWVDPDRRGMNLQIYLCKQTRVLCALIAVTMAHLQRALGKALIDAAQDRILVRALLATSFCFPN